LNKQGNDDSLTEQEMQQIDRETKQAVDAGYVLRGSSFSRPSSSVSGDSFRPSHVSDLSFISSSSEHLRQQGVCDNVVNELRSQLSFLHAQNQAQADSLGSYLFLVFCSLLIVFLIRNFALFFD
jgi:hypothetical protein